MTAGILLTTTVCSINTHSKRQPVLTAIDTPPAYETGRRSNLENRTCTIEHTATALFPTAAAAVNTCTVIMFNIYTVRDQHDLLQDRMVGSLVKSQEI